MAGVEKAVTQFIQADDTVRFIIYPEVGLCRLDWACNERGEYEPTAKQWSKPIWYALSVVDHILG